MDLSSKSYSPSQAFLQNSSLLSSYGLPANLATSLAVSSSMASPVYSGSASTGISQTPKSRSNGQSIASPPLNTGASSDNTVYSTGNASYRGTEHFPYGLSGVAMPSYGYPGDMYQFTSNGYPRKSRTCSYCGKVFTRSTTRRYHEKRCPLLRAAVSSYIGEETVRGNHTAPAEERLEKSKSTSTGQSFGPVSASGIGQTSDPQGNATSILLTPPPPVERREDSLVSGYTSVIVKQENHELDQAALGGTDSHSQEHDMSSILRLTPESGGSPNRTETSSGSLNFLSQGIDLISSSHTSSGQRQENTSLFTSDFNREQLLQNQSDLERSLNQSGNYTLDVQDPNEFDTEDINYDMPNNYHTSVYKSRQEGVSPKSEISGDNFNIQGETGDDTGDIEMGNENDSSQEIKDRILMGVFKCGICSKTFESTGKLHLHEQLHTRFKSYTCKFCGQRFAKVSMRVEHEKQHEGEDINCAVCGSLFTNLRTLKAHMRRGHQEGPWLCRHCGKASLVQTELKDHLLSHNLPKMERVSLLYLRDGSENDALTDEDGNANNNNLDETIETEMDKSELSTQPPPSFSTSQADGGHESEEPTQAMENCHECKRDFPKGYLNFHLKSHEAQKPYSCPICGKRFGYKNNMKSHIKLHTGVKPFQCNICGAKFTRGSTLRRHARRHGIIAESVWDLFIKPDYKTGRSKKAYSKHLNRNNSFLTPHTSTSITTQSNDLTLPGGNHDASALNYLDPSQQQHAAAAIAVNSNQSALYSMYTGFTQHITSRNMFPPNHTTSPEAAQIPHSIGYDTSSQGPQLDALNLSIQKPVDQQSDQSSISNASVERSRSRSRSLSGSESRRSAYAPIRPGHNDSAVQVNLCCGRNNSEVMLSSPQSMMMTQMMSPTAPAGSIEATSPSSLQSGKDYDFIAAMVASGKLFRCYHCDCFFMEYAMYRIHAKLHSRDFSRPFVCPVCGEDCHDKMYFSLHVSEHLR
ncbi:hypothetical protein CHS0354_019126 [Potamilus streckersoni]|uniref:C2H2-type domain-containing protein n=1 Tax=Potamilus streckersoni TaxID=2493646 RepID=A0AAE0SZU4_9BIVA|nr:hypothetical protein CHS0354_019126 [Potamilus streckersoni]